MTLNKRTKLGVTVAVAVLAGLTSGLAGMLVLVVAWLLIVWGQAPERTESFVGGLPGAAVAICVGIDFGVISIKTRLSDHAARSIV